MAHSPTELALEDVRAVYTLISQVCEHWADPMAWREGLLRGAMALTDSHVGSVIGQTLDANMKFGSPIPLAVVGMPDDVRKATLQRSIDQTNEQPVHDIEDALPGLSQFFERFAANGWATSKQDEFSSVEVYHASPTYVRFRGPANCDDFVMSVRAVDHPKHIEVITLDRPHGAVRFTPREVGLLRLLHDEVAPLVGVRLATEAHFSKDGLSQRLRGVLDLLLNGLSEKEAAGALGLAPATVHSHVGLLYDHFHVRSRAELMAYFVRRQPQLRSADPL